MKYTILKNIFIFIGILCFVVIMGIAAASTIEGKHILLYAIPVAVAFVASWYITAKCEDKEEE